MNPSDFLREPGYPFALLTTYTFDPFFFERLVLPDLWAGGSNSVAVFVDRRELERSLASAVGSLRHLGRRYFLVPMDLKGAFHPKIVLRLGSQGGLAWVGSGNLTRGGWGTNSEIASAWRIGEANGDPGAWARDLLVSLRTRAGDGLAADLLRRMEALAWLPSGGEEGERRVLFVGDESLAAQLERRWAGRQFSRLRIMTASTDPDGAMLDWAVRAFGIEDVDICVTPGRASYSAEAIDSIGARVSFVRTPAEKPLHAKLFWFEGAEGTAAVWGSANASRAAWLLPAHNVEAVVVDDAPSPAAFIHVLDAFSADPLPPDAVLVDRDAETEDATAVGDVHTVLNATRDVSGALELEVVPAIVAGAVVTFEVAGVSLPMVGAGARWHGSTLGALDMRASQIGRLRIETTDHEPGWSRPFWLDHPHELREVLAGRDFRTALDALRRFDSKQADYRLADEIGRIGHELLHDAGAYPDHRPRRRETSEASEAAREPLNPEALLRSLSAERPGAGGVPRIGATGTSVGGLFRALFSKLGAMEDEAQVIDDEGGGDSADADGGQGHTEGRPGTDSANGAQDADEKARKMLSRHLDRFFVEFEDPDFVDRCTANQLAQAACYPIAVSLMSERRGWSTDQQRAEWIERAISRLLRKDHFHQREAMLTAARRRYENAGELSTFHEAVGDGQMWVVLIAACDTLPVRTRRERLSKLTLMRELLSREDFFAAATVGRVQSLFREYYDPAAIERARAEVLRLGGQLLHTEAVLREHYDAIVSEQEAGAMRHAKRDLIWNRTGGWGEVERHEKGGKVDVFMIQAGDTRTLKAHGYFVNVTQLGRGRTSSDVGKEARTFLGILGS